MSQNLKHNQLKSSSECEKKNTDNNNKNLENQTPILTDSQTCEKIYDYPSKIFKIRIPACFLKECKPPQSKPSLKIGKIIIPTCFGDKKVSLVFNTKETSNSKESTSQEAKPIISKYSNKTKSEHDNHSIDCKNGTVVPSNKKIPTQSIIEQNDKKNIPISKRKSDRSDLKTKKTKNNPIKEIPLVSSEDTIRKSKCNSLLPVKDFTDTKILNSNQKSAKIYSSSVEFNYTNLNKSKNTNPIQSKAKVKNKKKDTKKQNKSKTNESSKAEVQLNSKLLPKNKVENKNLSRKKSNPIKKANLAKIAKLYKMDDIKNLNNVDVIDNHIEQISKILADSIYNFHRIKQFDSLLNFKISLLRKRCVIANDFSYDFFDSWIISANEENLATFDAGEINAVRKIENLYSLNKPL